jgi:hypothetical protein
VIPISSICGTSEIGGIEVGKLVAEYASATHAEGELDVAGAEVRGNFTFHASVNLFDVED